MQISYKLMSIR